MLINQNRNVRAAVAPLVALVVLLLAVGVASAQEVRTWRWKGTVDDGRRVVSWNSAFLDGQTRYRAFPPDTRQKLRDSFAQWDDSNIPGSNLSRGTKRNLMPDDKAAMANKY